MATVDIKLGSNTLNGVETIKVTDATDNTNIIDFTYGVTPSGSVNIKLGNNTLNSVNTLSVLGADTTYKTFGYAEQIILPTKGDIINIDMTGSGTAQTYRVLKNVGGSVVEVLAMANASTIAFDAVHTRTYKDKTLDTYLNTTWYNTLSATAKSAIVDKTFRQDSWYRDTTGNPDYQGKYGGDAAYQLSLGNASFGNEITRHCYAISVQDVIDYLETTPEMTQVDTTLTYDNVWTMFWNSTTSHSDNIWLCSASASNAYRAFSVSGGSGYLSNPETHNTYAARPAFQIDLSKIQWSSND